MTVKNIIVMILGAILFVGWHFFIGLKWNNVASLDIVSGAILEFYLFTYIISEFEKRTEIKRQKEMDAHLKNIEKLLKKVKAKQEGENDVENL